MSARTSNRPRFSLPAIPRRSITHVGVRRVSHGPYIQLGDDETAPVRDADLTQNHETDDVHYPKDRMMDLEPNKENRPLSSLSNRPESRKSRTNPVSRPESRQSHISLTNTRRTISRTGKKPRPEKIIPPEDGEKKGESDCESEETLTQPQVTTQPRVTTFDIIEYGVDITDDQGWDTDLEIEEIKEAYDVTGKSIYLEACKKNEVIPASYFLRHMLETNLEMKHHGLGPQGIKPLAVSLVSNTSVLKLNLSDNWLGEDGGQAMCEMLKENCYIYDLDLSDNRLGPSFAEPFCNVLINFNNTLTHVTLSGNNLDDKAAIFFAEAIMNTTKLEYFNLSHNNFGESAGIALGPAISENSTIKEFDLSWNNIRGRGPVALAQGVKTNVFMKKINLAWNGFGREGAVALGDALKGNSVLEELDISNNRINTEGAVNVGKGVSVNETLKILRMGKNPMQSAGCYAVCAAILKNQNCILEEVDFSDILVNNDFKEIFGKVKEMLPDIKLRHGGEGQPKKAKARVHPMVKLKNYIDKNNLRLVDFFNKFDKDHSMSVTREEFAAGIEETGIKLTEEEVSLLLDELDKDGDGEINYSELVIGHQDFTEKEKRLQNAIQSYGKPCPT